MVKICPKCGTKDPDDEAVFCHKCGNRLPPRIPEKKEIICPSCGTKIPDMQAVFCDKCGSRLHAAPPVLVRQVRQRPKEALPDIPREHCPSCGAPFVDEISDYCNVCGAHLRGGAPPGTAREPRQFFPEKTGAGPLTASGDTYQPSPEKEGPAQPAADRADDGRDYPVQKKSRGPLLKWGLIAGVAVIVLLVTGAFITGMIPGTNKSANATPALNDQSSGTALTTRETTQAAAPARTPSPAKKTTSPVPATAVTTVASATRAANASTNLTANASVTVTKTRSITDASRLLSLGQSAYDGKGTLTVNEFSFKDKMSDPTPSYAIGKKYLVVSITYENLQQSETLDADLSMMKVTDGGGFPYEPASDNLLENVYTGKSILPREKRTGNLLFIVPPEATLLKLHYSFGNQKNATFQLT